MYTFASLLVTEHTKGKSRHCKCDTHSNVMKLPIPFLNATDVCCSQSVVRGFHGTDPWHFQKKKHKPPQNVHTCEGPPGGRSMSDWPEGTPAPLRVNWSCTSHFSLWVFVTRFCRSPWSVSEGVVVEILGVSVFRILFLRVTDACLIS